MKWCVFLLMMTAAAYCYAQQPPLTQRQEQQLENLAEKDEALPEDESLLQQLEIFRNHPVNLNTAAQDELQLLQILTDIQIKALLQYRALLGKFIHVYELQAIPYWDVHTIQRILPYITIRHEVAVRSFLSEGVGGGSSDFLLRWSRPGGKAEGFTDTGSGRFLGSPDKLLVRYRYNYKNLLQFGVLGDKDAGESLIGKKHNADLPGYKTGFDFYSFHLFTRKMGVLQALAIGDFTVNMGQGLIQWQSMAFGKGELTAIKRQSAILRPYNSPGEFNFHRGVGFTVQQKRCLLTAFYSLRRMSANLAADTVDGQAVISSFLTSGMNRNEKELSTRNNIRQRAMGGNISYEHAGGHVGINIIQYHFSIPILKRQEPYNLFAFRGSRALLYSLDYDHTFRNLHVFGELAADRRLHKAVINGLVLSMDRKMDMSLLVRHMDAGFQAVQASAFTENTLPSNESGIFIGIACKPWPRMRIDAYADVFRFPWLKFRADAPSAGREFQVQWVYQPRKGVEIMSRFRSGIRQSNTSGGADRVAWRIDGPDDPGGLQPGPSGGPRWPWSGTAAGGSGHEMPFYFLSNSAKKSWRIHVSWLPGEGWQASQRVELVWVGSGAEREQGYMVFLDVRYDPANRPYALSGRVQLFDTDGFNSRIYAVEQDVPYAAPAAYHKGIRYYINGRISVGKRPVNRKMESFPRVNVWLRWAATLAEMQAGTASAPKRGEYKIQVSFSSF